VYADNNVHVQVTHPECNIDQHDVEANNTDYMSDISFFGSLVDDPTYDSKMVGNANQEIITDNGIYTTGRADSSVGVPVIHSDSDMERKGINDVIPNNQS
jgi:hypothetical protein